MNASDALTEEQGGEQPIRYVLFVCNHNAGRSQMAQAFFERYGPEDIRAESAGNEPAAEIWPTVIEAMSEITGPEVVDQHPVRRAGELLIIGRLHSSGGTEHFGGNIRDEFDGA